jgi:hypothetical protein
MQEFIIFMHDDAPADGPPGDWESYLGGLQARGVFDGGSEIGRGLTIRKSGEPRPVSSGLGGYIRVRAASLAEAQTLIIGNPVYERGGTVEIRELPQS